MDEKMKVEVAKQSEKEEKKFAKKSKRKEKVKIVKVGKRRKSVLVLWGVLILSAGFGIYKNFTAIDTKTEVVKEIVEMKLFDTNGIESFVRNFVVTYYTFENTKEGLEKKNESLGLYLTEELQSLELSVIPDSVVLGSSFKNIQIWNVENISEFEYDVTYSVGRDIKEITTKKNDKGKEEEVEIVNYVSSSYVIRVRVDEFRNMIIVKNPTLCSIPEKMNYKKPAERMDSTVDVTAQEELKGFLDVFFALYPNATKEELVYYIKDNVLGTIQGQYTLLEVLNPVFQREGERVQASFYVRYYDASAKGNQISQYNLTLEKSESWKIVGVN